MVGLNNKREDRGCQDPNCPVCNGNLGAFEIPGVGMAISVGSMGKINNAGPLGQIFEMISKRGSQRERPSVWEEKNEEGLYELVIALPYHQEIEELLSLRKRIAQVQDGLADEAAGTWEDFLGGDVDAFDRLSEFGHEKIQMVQRLLLEALMTKRLSIPLEASKASADTPASTSDVKSRLLEIDELGEKLSTADFSHTVCGDLLIYFASDKQDFRNDFLNDLFRNMRASLLEFSTDHSGKETTLAELQEKEKAVLAKLPQELHDVTELPELRIPRMVLTEPSFVKVVKDYLAARSVE